MPDPNDLAYRFNLPDGTRPLLEKCPRALLHRATQYSERDKEFRAENCNHCHGTGLVPLPPAERHMALEEALRGLGYEVTFGVTKQRSRPACSIFKDATVTPGGGPTWPAALEAAASQLPEARG